jgi:hypothetical protein
MQHAKSPERMHILAHTANVIPKVILKIKSSFMAIEYGEFLSCLFALFFRTK